MTRPIVALLALPLACALISATLSTSPSQQESLNRPEKTALQKHMGEINHGVRNITKLLRAEDGRSEILSQVSRIQKIIIDAKSEVPMQVAKIEIEERRRAERVHFRLALNNLLRGFLELEDAVLQGEDAAIGAALGALGELKDMGHKRFKAPNRER